MTREEFDRQWNAMRAEGKSKGGGHGNSLPHCAGLWDDNDQESIDKWVEENSQ